jgi:hypothetical protein
MFVLLLAKLGAGGARRQRITDYTGRSPFTVTRVPERVCGQ